MAKSRHDRRAGRRPVTGSGRDFKARARAGLGGRRGTRRGARARRRLLVPLASVGVVLGVVAGLVAVNLTSGGTAASEIDAPATAVAQVTNVTASVLSQVGAGRTAASLQPVNGGSALSIDDKAGIVFVSEESCPFCAAERWPVVIALSHFGTWGHLGATTSSSTDIYPNTATFSFRDATYHSPYLTLRTTELTDNAGHALQAPSPLDNMLIDRYDVPPYVDSADQSGAVPFLDIDNHYILAGAQYNPQVLAGMSVSQIAAQLDDPSSPLAKAVDGSANALIAAIDQVLHSTGTRN
jgi:hypothetical protein